MKNVLTGLLLLACAVYSMLLISPGLYFSGKLQYKDFTLRYRGPAPVNYEGSLDSAAERLASSDLFKEGEKFDIYLPSSRLQFSLFAPLQSGEYFRVTPFNGHIFVAAADFGKGEARKRPGDSDYRSLSGVIAGGAAVEQTRRKMKPLTYMFMNEWKVRGYAERVSGGTGRFNPPDACGKPATPEQLDYKYGLMLDTVLKEDNAHYNDLLDRNFSRQNAEQRVNRAYCGG